MIIEKPIKTISEIVAIHPTKLVPLLDSLLPRKKGKKVTNLSTLSKPELHRIISTLRAAV